MLCSLRSCSRWITRHGPYDWVGKSVDTLRVALSSVPARTGGRPVDKTASVKPPSRSTICLLAAAVKRYRDSHPPGPDGLLVIPSSVVIKYDDQSWPESLRGMKLGWRLQRLVAKHTNFHTLHEQFRDVQVIGAAAKKSISRAARFTSDDVMQAVSEYRKIHKVPPEEKACIPRAFVVPHGSPDWPSGLWGLRLGMKVTNMYHNRFYERYFAKLHALVQLGERKRGRKEGTAMNSLSITRAAERFCLAVKTYRQVHAIPEGDTVTIPSDYIVPSDDSRWPQELWGMKLGRTVSNVLYNGAYSQFQEQLAELHLPSKGSRVQNIIDAVKVYKQLRGLGDGEWVAIPISFKVPEGDDRWPKELQGRPLGAIVRRILAHNAYIENYDTFQDLGLFPQKRLAAARIIQALETYRQIHYIPEGERLQIPLDFVVPERAEEWPQSLWGMKLGALAANVVYSRSFQKTSPRLLQRRLKELGLYRARAESHEEYAKKRMDQILLGAKTYIANYRPAAAKTRKGEKKRNFNIPQTFVVPSDDPRWPEELWGMKLGVAIKNVVYGTHFPAIREELYRLGLMRFSEQPPDILQVELVQKPFKGRPRLIDS